MVGTKKCPLCDGKGKQLHATPKGLRYIKCNKCNATGSYTPLKHKVKQNENNTSI